MKNHNRMGQGILFVVFVTLSIFSLSSMKSRSWIFIDDDGREYTGQASANSWDAHVKPWSQVVNGKTGVLRLNRGNGQIFIDRTYKDGRLHGHYRGHRGQPLRINFRR